MKDGEKPIKCLKKNEHERFALYDIIHDPEQENDLAGNDQELYKKPISKIGSK